MVAINENEEQSCQTLLLAFYKKHPNPHLQVEVNRVLQALLDSKTPMPGKTGGWAGGIVYAVANSCKRACGIPGLLNSEIQEFFNVSMHTIYKRAWMIRSLLLDI